MHVFQNQPSMKNKGSIQLFHTRVFHLYGCPHVGFIQCGGLVLRGIVPVFLGPDLSKDPKVANSNPSRGQVEFFSTCPVWVRALGVALIQ